MKSGVVYFLLPWLVSNYLISLCTCQQHIHNKKVLCGLCELELEMR